MDDPAAPKRGALGQRYVDLIVCDDYQLRQMRDRFILMKRTALMMHAKQSVLDQWQSNIDAIDQELAMRHLEEREKSRKPLAD